MGLKTACKISRIEEFELETKWTQAFCEANIPVNIVHHPTFIEAMKATKELKKMQITNLLCNAQNFTWQCTE